MSNINNVAIETDDIDQVFSTLSSNGFDATDKKLGCDKSWQSWTKDPNGVKKEFHKYTDESL